VISSALSILVIVKMVGVNEYCSSGIERIMATKIAPTMRVITTMRIIPIAWEVAESRCMDSWKFFSVSIKLPK
jgi:hypothetical protein